MVDVTRQVRPRPLRRLGRVLRRWLWAIMRGMFVLGAALGPGVPPPPPPPPPAIEQDDSGAPDEDA